MANFSMQNHGPIMIGAGLAVVLAAQYWTAVPVAAAIALIGCGAMCAHQKAATVGRVDIFRHQQLRHCGSLLVYAALVGLAVGAQLHLHTDAIYVADAVAAVLLLLTAGHSAFQRTDSASSW